MGSLGEGVMVVGSGAAAGTGFFFTRLVFGTFFRAGFEVPAAFASFPRLFRRGFFFSAWAFFRMRAISTIIIPCSDQDRLPYILDQGFTDSFLIPTVSLK